MNDEQIVEKSKAYGLTVKTKKIKIMLFSKKSEKCKVSIDRSEMEQVSSFKYRSTIFG